MQSPLFFLGVFPALAAPVFGFRFAYGRACREIRRALDDLLDAAEVGPPKPGGRPRTVDDRPQGPIQGLEPIPRFVPEQETRRRTPERSARSSLRPPLVSISALQFLAEHALGDGFVAGAAL